MIRHTALTGPELHGLLRRRALTLGGNRKLRIYGRLDCRSGKRMKAENRVFFRNEADALANGYRPCGHCMRPLYDRWKQRQL